MRPRKRQKLDGAPDRTIVAADNLPWRETSPAHLDDYEGFYGLEEIEDVDVTRDSATGQITFRHAKPAVTAPARPKVATNTPIEDEWLGFSDAESQASVSTDDDSLLGGFEVLQSHSTNLADADIKHWQAISGISDATLSSLATLQFTKPTPIQSSTIPLILDGRDLIGKAPTGSGKTLAFGIPIFEKWLSEMSAKTQNAERTPVALIIEPARELAHQIESHLSQLRSEDGKSLRIATLTGGLSSQKQKRLLERADVIVATPGRLWDIMSEEKQVLKTIKSIRTLVIDEADRLLSPGHFQELEQILSALDRDDQATNGEDTKTNTTKRSSRQTLVFSATFAKELQHKLGRISKQKFSKEQNSMGYLLQKLNFRQQPKYIDINPDAQMAANLTEALLEVSDMNKDLYLYSLLLLFQPQMSIRALVFVNSIDAVRRLVPFLQLLNFNALPLHSGMEQKARLRSVERFTGGNVNVNSTKGISASSILVATDVAARGLDIPEVHVVIHYHLPRAADMYIHRSGRTARANASGASILMAGANEAAGVKRLISQVHAEKPKRSKRELRVVAIEDRILGQLRQRAQLAKKIADVEQAKEKSGGGDKLFQEAADDLGVDLGELGELTDDKGRGGRGRRRKEKQAEAQAVTKGQLRGAKAELKDLLEQRIRVEGANARYLANGTVDMDRLIAENKNQGGGGLFLGRVEGLQLL